jgi:group II intron reverse transcriptase/maturase
MSHGRGKSDRGVVPKKLPNKAVGAIPVAAEAVEGRLRAKGNAAEQRMSRRSMRVYDMQTALDGIRQTARGRPGAKFTTLMNHIYQPERLQAAYLALKRDAAAGVDGQTWASYGQDLQANLLDLSDRLGRGGYRPQPVKRAYIDKADGSKRPLGVPALEDKIVQRATVEVLNAIYEQDFLGFSYGFRPGKSAHNALDAVAVGVQIKKVNWILDADISKFFDTIEHDWLVKFIEHRVADARVVRLIKKWLHAGVLEDGQVTRSEQGTVQGGSISPLLANIYLHYVLDLWGNQWRGRHARGDMVIVRYADDWVAGFERRQDAERFAREVTQRLQKYGLALNATKTRLIEFGRQPPATGTRQARDLRLPGVHALLRNHQQGKVHGPAADQCQAHACQAACGEGRDATAHAPPNRRAGPVPAKRGGRACALLRRARQRPAHAGLPVPSGPDLASNAEAAQPEQAAVLAPHEPPCGSLGAFPAHLPPLPEPASDRHHPRQEPYAVAPHVRICRGGAG